MIPALPVTAASEGVSLRFLDELLAGGFEGDVSHSEADRTVFATDNSIYQIRPQGVIFPRATADIARILRLASMERFRTIVLAPRGGGTGTNGQSLTSGLVVDLSRHMNRILEINPGGRWARVECGVVKDQLNTALAPHGLFFAPELSTSNRATLGGMINTDASGQGSCRYGKTRDHVLELTSVLVGGGIWRSRPLEADELPSILARTDIVGAVHRLLEEIHSQHAAQITARFPPLNRCLTGYDLAHIRDAGGRLDLNSILCGSEGTLAIIAEAKVAVLPTPRRSVLVNIRYGSFDAALRDARTLMAFAPASIEILDARVFALAQQDIAWDGVKDYFPLDDRQPVQGVNLVEFVGDAEDEVEVPLRRLAAAIQSRGKDSGTLGHTVARGEAVGRVWRLRKGAAGILGNMRGDRRPIPFVEDTAVPPENLADYAMEFRRLLDSRGLSYGMFGHVDAGVLHVRPAIDMRDPGQAALIRELTDAVFELTRRYGGLLWGEHGKGMRSQYTAAVFGPLYPLLNAVKAAFDPHNQLNPGKIASPGGQPLLAVDGVPTQGEADRMVQAEDAAGYPAAMRCNGNGACFNYDPNDSMCPSWKGTRQRRHSPKGRATLMREWLRQLSVAGVSPLAEAAALRKGARSRSFPLRLLNTVRPSANEDFSHLVREAMDGCLACKSCSSGCPTKVDIPSLRASFFEIYHGRYLRPPRHHVVGLLEHALPLAARTPRLYNVATASRIGRAALRQLGLVDVPRLAAIDFPQELRRRRLSLAVPAQLAAIGTSALGRHLVIVQDAFTRYYDTRVVLDVLDLARALGFTPWLAPFRPNGKALYVHGFLGRFRQVAQHNASMLRTLADCGVALVGIDPSVTLTYRTEYVEALGTAAVPRVLLLQEWLAQNLAGMSRRELPFPLAAAPMRLLPHCTERALARHAPADWQTVFAHFGLRLEVPASGCCGMAGTYGHERHHREASERIYGLSWRQKVMHDQALAPLATGYSCRSQAKRLNGVTLLHPAQALLASIRRGAPGAGI